MLKRYLKDHRSNPDTTKKGRYDIFDEGFPSCISNYECNMSFLYVISSSLFSWRRVEENSKRLFQSYFKVEERLKISKIVAKCWGKIYAQSVNSAVYRKTFTLTAHLDESIRWTTSNKRKKAIEMMLFKVFTHMRVWCALRRCLFNGSVEILCPMIWTLC